MQDFEEVNIYKTEVGKNANKDWITLLCLSKATDEKLLCGIFENIKDI